MILPIVPGMLMFAAGLVVLSGEYIWQGEPWRRGRKGPEWLSRRAKRRRRALERRSREIGRVTYGCVGTRASRGGSWAFGGLCSPIASYSSRMRNSSPPRDDPGASGYDAGRRRVERFNPKLWSSADPLENGGVTGGRHPTVEDYAVLRALAGASSRPLTMAATW
jgi:hypothetical protein